jgi:predicted AAA+ superfamily ATPase
MLRDDIVYVQVCLYLGDDAATISREFNPLMAIEDNFPKYVVSLDETWSSGKQGIRRMHLADFLLTKEI